MSFDIVCLSKVDVLSNADCIVLEDHCRFFANSCVHESLQIVCIWTIYRAWFHELIISGCKPMIRCIFYTDVYQYLVHWSFSIIMLSHRSQPHKLSNTLAIMIGYDDKVRTTIDHTIFWSIHVLNYRHCLYMSATRSMSVQDHCCKNFTVLSNYGSAAKYIRGPRLSISLAFGNAIYIRHCSPLSISWWRPMTSLPWIISHTEYTLGHGLRSHILMDCNLLVSDREG